MDRQDEIQKGFDDTYYNKKVILNNGMVGVVVTFKELNGFIQGTLVIHIQELATSFNVHTNNVIGIEV